MNKENFLELTKDFEHIIFDFGGIFINIKYEKMLERLSALCCKEIDKDFFIQAKQDPIFSELEVGQLSEQDFITKLSNLLGLRSKEKVIIEAWNSILFDIPLERIEFIRELKFKHKKKIYLLSNINSIHEKFIQDYLDSNNLNFYNLFDKIFFSHHIKMRKPNKDIFNYVLKSLEIKAKDAFFMDDSIQHINAARELGITSFHLEVQNSFVVSFKSQ